MTCAGRSAPSAARVCLLGLVALALGACANPDSVKVTQVDCHASQLQVGAVCGGGVVYDLNFQGLGIVLSVDPQSYAAVTWGPSGTIAQTDDLNNGRDNTGTFDPGFNASWFCQQHIAAGRVDWYLPAANELSALYGPSTGGQVPALPGQLYWSSTEDPTTNAFAVDFSSGPAPVSQARTTSLAVVCIRRPKVVP